MVVSRYNAQNGRKEIKRERNGIKLCRNCNLKLNIYITNSPYSKMHSQSQINREGMLMKLRSERNN